MGHAASYGGFQLWRRCEGGPGREVALLGLVRGRDGQHAHGLPEVRDDRGQRGDVVRHVLIRLALQARLLEQRRSQSGRVACGRVRVGMLLLREVVCVRLVCTGQLGAVLGEDLAEQLRRASHVRLPLGAQLVPMLAEQLRGAGGLRLALGAQLVPVLTQHDRQDRAMFGVDLLEALGLRLCAGVEQRGEGRDARGLLGCAGACGRGAVGSGSGPEVSRWRALPRPGLGRRRVPAVDQAEPRRWHRRRELQRRGGRRGGGGGLGKPGLLGRGSRRGRRAWGGLHRGRGGRCGAEEAVHVSKERHHASAHGDECLRLRRACGLLVDRGAVRGAGGFGRDARLGLRAARASPRARPPARVDDGAPAGSGRRTGPRAGERS
jgi:hypothetical protein